MRIRKLIALTIVLSVAAGVAAFAANCECYYASDCRKGQYCNWKDQCTRHCELQGTWNPTWGAPPQSSPDCDNWSGACHDNEPSPPQGDDGDGENCEPPSHTNPDGDDMEFKMQDGMCATRPVAHVPELEEQDATEVAIATSELVAAAASGGGEMSLDASPYVRTMMENLALLGLGQYEFRFRLGDTPVMADVRGTCAPDVLAALGRVLEETIRRQGIGQFEVQPIVGDAGHGHHGESTELPGYIAARLESMLSDECATWMQTRPHNCQYPHPPEHAHEFEYEDGLQCIGHNIASMAESLYLD